MGDETRSLPKMTARERTTWERLAGFYGSLLGEKYGLVMPVAWREDLARLTDDQLGRALAVVRVDHLQFPPTLGEFLKAARPPMAPARAERSVQERLCDYAAQVIHPRVVTGEIALAQYSGPWRYVCKAVTTFDEAGREKRGSVCVGVLIPGGGSAPDIYVSAADMEMASAA